MTHAISAIVLAGGQGRRMGGSDKGWVCYRGRPLIELVLARLHDQSDDIVISCNRNVPRYAALRPVAVDQSKDYLGPLAGITAAGRLCRHQWIQICPCDTPDIPLDLSRQLLTIAQRREVDAVTPADATGRHYLCSLVHQRTLISAAAALARGDLAVRAWLASVNACTTRIAAPRHAFANLNTREQLLG